MSRRTAREIALAALYQIDISRSSTREAFSSAISFFPGAVEKAVTYAMEIVEGVSEARQDIDAALRGVLEGWELERLPAIERNIMRMAVYEIYRRTDVPHSVSIDEAVELAKIYGSDDDSPRFVNGVLAKVLKGLPEDGTEQC